MGLYPTAFRAELAKPRSQRERLVGVTKIHWNGDASPTYYSDGPFLNCLPDIEEFATAGRGVQTRSASAIQKVETNVLIKDTTRTLCRKLEGAYDVRRSPVTNYYAFPNLAEASWHVVSAGVVDGWEAVRAGWRIRIRPDDFWMDGFAPKVPLLTGEWPSIPDVSKGVYAPIAYGVHDSQNHSGKGFVRCPPGSFVASTTGVYVVSLGVCGAVDRVTVDGVLKTLTTHYTVQQGASYGGKTWTTITFTAGNIPAATAVVTADVKGLTDTGASTGAVITNPVAQLRHAITNFLYGDWRSGAWLLESSSPIDSASWDTASAFADQYRLDGSLYLGNSADQKECGKVIATWLDTWQIFRMYWNNTGKLALRVLPVEHPGYGTGSAFDTIQEADDELGQTLQTRMDTQNLVQRISAAYLQDVSQSKRWNALDVQDLNQDEKISSSVTMENGPARVN